MEPQTKENNTNWNLLFLCWLIASVSALGSLFFSEVLNYPPCKLCWYQRICLFPLPLILLVGLFPFNKNTVRFAFPLVAIGWLISVYHNLLYMGIIPKSMQPCDKALSCTDVQLNLFGFVTIPFLSFLSFSILAAVLWLLHRRSTP